MDEYLALTRLILVAALLTMGMTKCREYGKLVYTEEESPVLRIAGAADKKERVSKCEIVETPLIIGGVAAEPSEFPHMAVIGYGNDPVSWMCGGSVVSENFVLTAAHCLEAPDKGPARKIRVGLTDLTNAEGTPDFQERKILERIAHPEYSLPSRYHDVALLRVDESLRLGPRVRPACLEIEPNLPKDGSKVIATGFGRTSSENPGGSDRLMKVTLDYVSSADCERYFAPETGGRRMSRGLLLPNMMCAGFAQGGKDTCQGDSGGPLQRVLADPYCTYSIVGVTSFGKFCAQKNSPAVYTRVSSYVDWIESVVWP